jgi:DNA-binding protein YbaB
MHDTEDDKQASGSDHDAMLAEARRRMEQCTSADGHDRTEALEDLRFLKGEQWDPRDAALRASDGRPCLTINKLPAFLRQVTNDQRQNKPGIKVHPVDDGADPETAKVLQGLIRHIEYSSNADVAYDTAVNSAAACGRGFFAIETDYESETSFDQVARFKRIRNPFTVYFDPNSKEPDGSDARWCLISEDMPRSEFVELYPDAQAAQDGWARAVGDKYPGWLDAQTVRVCAYYRVEEKPATLVMLTTGEAVYEDEAPDDAEIALDVKGKPITRKSTKRVVMRYLVTALDVLDETEVPCRWIPVFPVYGEELDIEGKVHRSGLVRNARDPQRMYNFWMTAATEEVALRPKAPFIGAAGQFDGDSRWATANKRSHAYLEYEPITVDGQMAPPPQRQPMADVPVGTLQLAMHASDNIKATTGIHDASLGAQGNETSGRAIMARQREGDVSNFHFTDNLSRSIRHAGRCLLQMIPRVYDTPRVVRILGDDETVTHAKVNQPLQQPEVNEETGAIKTVLNDLTVGNYDVTVAAGPSYTTLRQEAADAMVQFGQSWPKLMDIAGDKVVRAMDWPGAEEIAERIERTIPPELRGEEGQGPPQLPPEAQQQMAQMQGYIQHLEQQLQAAASGIEKARIDAESRERVAQINAVGRQDVEEIKGWVQLLAQRMQPPPQLTAAALNEAAPEAASSFSPPGADAAGEQAPNSVPSPDGQDGQQIVG